MVRRTGLELLKQPAVPGHDRGPGQRLRWHAERVAERQPVQRPRSARLLSRQLLSRQPLGHHWRRTSARLTTSTSGLYSRRMSSACPWLTSLTPAHASSTTWTSTPASAAATAVDSTQQSVHPPPSPSRPPSPTRSDSSGPHLLNVVASSICSG